MSIPSFIQEDRETLYPQSLPSFSALYEIVLAEIEKAPCHDELISEEKERGG